MATTFEDAWQAASGVEGWLLPAQGKALFEAGRRLLPGTVAVEIGSHRGKSAILIASGLQGASRLTAVDPFDDPRWGGGPESLEKFTANIEAAGVASRIDLFRGISSEASAQWDGTPVGLLWVDGAHDLESTLADFDGWLPYMAPGSEIYVHDAFSAIGTTKAIMKRFFWSSQVHYTGCERTLVKFQVLPTTFSERVVSALGICSRLPFFARMLAIKLARRKGMKSLERKLMREDNEPLI
jgi:predicted O-methyltransferase YrrM